jgi:hypothetical protein
MENSTKASVLYNATCPVCKFEIQHYVIFVAVLEVRQPNVALVSYSPIFGQISGVFKLLPAPADRFHCC